MGVFDSLGGMLGGAIGDQGAAGLEALLGQAGGLDGIVKQLEASGLGEQVSSWLGSGKNLPVDADSIAGALGGDNLRQMAKFLGVDSSQVAAQLADMLPGIIDKASPNGSLLTDLTSLFK